MKTPRKSASKRASNSFTTKSGKTIKIQRSMSGRKRARKEAKSREKAEYLSTLPKNRVKRTLYRMHPKRVAGYWFSRKGAMMALTIVGVGILTGFILLVGIFAYFRKDLPDITDISGKNLGGSITYYDRTGQTVLWQDYDAVQRLPVKDTEISPYLKKATIAIEDKNFYNHGAFDVTGIARAVWADVSGGSRQGGSTITQQLVKLSQDWTEDRTYTRKVKELILAVELEREYSKDQILTGYLNMAPYGGIEYGAEAAARNYFQVSAKDLTLEQAAFLAALPKAPSVYSPYSQYFDAGEAVGRQQYIIDQMVKQKMITQEQADAAKKVDIVASVKPRQNKYSGIKAPYFVLAAKNELEQKYGEKTVNRGGWKVTTTLDMNLQQEAETQVAKDLPIVKRQGGDNIAFGAEDVQTGQMVALVGGVDFTNTDYGQMNYAQTPLPPGSSFKPYDYATLIENSDNAGAGSLLYDTQAPITGYPCTNKGLPKNGGNCLWDYDFKYPGPMTIRYALGGSRNVPAVKAMLIAGVEKTIKTAESMGLTSGYKCYSDEQYTKETACYGASAIGDGAFLKLDEHVNGYATFSRMGEYIDKTYILKIVDATGKEILAYSRPKGRQAIKPDTAYIVADMMSDPNASYMTQKTHSTPNGWKIAVKTGTTNDAKDGWMMGYTAKYAAGVWVGYHDRTKAMTGYMETMTRPVLYNWMVAAHANIPAQNWTKPEGVKTAPAYVVRNNPGLGARVPSAATDLYPSWYKPKAGATTSQVIDKVSNKVATDCTPEAAKMTVGNSNSNTFSIDIFVDAKNTAANTSATDDVHNCGDTKPSVAAIIAPAQCSVGKDCTVTVTVSEGTHPLSDSARADFPGTVELVVNGASVGTQPAVSLTPINFTFQPAAEGTLTLEARVTDSVLYGGSSTSTLIVTPATVTFNTNSSPTYTLMRTPTTAGAA